VVTHSPQVAARASNHYIVAKLANENSDVVTTTVIPLPEIMERREEIARMISGEDISDEARSAAAKLMGTGS
jgi:DNA repair protein RecN (Recombination protein N)